MDATVAMADSCGETTPAETAISKRLIILSLLLQALDVLITLLNVQRGLFSVGPGPVGRLLGFGPGAMWLLMKGSSFAILLLAVMKGRRWLLLLLDAWLVAFVAFNVFVLVS